MTYKGLSFQKVWLFRSTVSEISFRQGLCLGIGNRQQEMKFEKNKLLDVLSFSIITKISRKFIQSSLRSSADKKRGGIRYKIFKGCQRFDNKREITHQM